MNNERWEHFFFENHTCFFWGAYPCKKGWEFIYKDFFNYEKKMFKFPWDTKAGNNGVGNNGMRERWNEGTMILPRPYSKTWFIKSG